MLYDYIIIGSGFGGSVCALRLVEKGYKVLLIEEGRRFSANDFANSNLNIKKFFWVPLLRCFGMTKLSLFSHVLVQHGCGYGGGSLGYANVMHEPNSEVMTTTHLGKIIPWQETMPSFYQKAREMLGAQENPKLWPMDRLFKQVFEEFKCNSFTPAKVAVFFGEENKEVPDPYFNGKGPNRVGCTHCGACMIGCKVGAKNTLDKNYLYLAEKLGLKVQTESKVTNIIPTENKNYTVQYKSSTQYVSIPKSISTKNVIVAGGVLGTLKLLLHCRDVTKSLPNISQKLGYFVRTNGEALLTTTRFDNKIDHTQGVAITSAIQVDKVTQAQLVHFSAGASLLQWLSVPAFFNASSSILIRLFLLIFAIIKAPIQFIKIKFFPNWATRSILFLFMVAHNTKSGSLVFKLRRKFFRYVLTSKLDNNTPSPPAAIKVAHDMSNFFAKRNHAGAHMSFTEGILNTPTTAHILGGCPMAENENEGVIAKNFAIFNYPGLFVVDGSVITEDLGVNPALTITALAEFAMSQIKGYTNE